MTIWDEWRKNHIVKKKHLDTETIKKQKAETRQMTEDEKKMAKRLNGCSLRRPGSHQRMVEALVRAAQENTEISERQAWTLRGLYYTYRRQHGDTNAKKPDGWV